MFQFKNGRFYANVKPQRLSFVMPQGCWLDTMPLVMSQELLPLYSPDMKVNIDLWAEREDEADTKERLTDLVKHNSDCVLVEPRAITVNGIAGYETFYAAGKKQYYDVYLNVSSYGLVDSKGESINRVRMLLYTEDGGDIYEIVASDSVQAALHGIKVE
ncbi:MAG: hypothetical protein LUE24_09355 [Lachnospiraceae bacterium]|nr:hypothetical protein [Lachnospiraceae bacterium]